ncbi:MAG: TIM44-like domain-containing protein [Marinicella pacifica]
MGEAAAFSDTSQEIIRSWHRGLSKFLLIVVIVYLAVIFLFIQQKKKKAQQILKKIANKDYVWDPLTIKQWVSEVFEEVYFAYQHRDTKTLKDISTEQFLQSFERQFRQYDKGLMDYHLEGYVMTGCEVVAVEDFVDNNQDNMAIVVSCELFEYLIFKPENTVVKGEKEFLEYQRLWYFKRRQDKWLLDKIEPEVSLTVLKSLSNHVENN